MLCAACGALRAPFRYRAGGPIPRVLAEQAPYIEYLVRGPEAPNRSLHYVVTQSALRSALSFRRGAPKTVSNIVLSDQRYIPLEFNSLAWKGQN